MRFKNKGFSLIETLMAIVVIGLVLAPLFVQESLIFNSVSDMAHRFRRFLFAQQFLYDARRAQPVAARDFSLDRREENPPMQIKYRLMPVPEQSVLARKKTVCREQVSAADSGRDGARELIINFVFKPEGDV